MKMVYNPKIGLYNQWRNQYNVVLSDTHVISQNLINELRGGYSRDDSMYGGTNRGLDVVAGAGLILEDLQDVRALPRMDIVGFQSIYQGDQNGWMWSNFYVQDTLHWTRGRHNFKFGLDWAKYNGRQWGTSASKVYGDYRFNGRFTGDPYADFLLGIMDRSRRGTSVGPVYPHRSNTSLFITDDFKVTPRLSLNFGLRYSLLDPGVVEQDLVANFIPQYNALVVPSEAALARVHPGFPKDVPIVTAASVGLGRRLLNLDKNNFAPRFSFAWRPGPWDDFVIRGGFGIYYIAMQPYVSDGGRAPFELAESFTNTIENGVPSFSFPRPFPDQGFLLGGTSGGGLNPDTRTPYSTQYSLTVEKQIGQMAISAFYTSTLSRKRVWRRDLNQPPANEIPFAEKRPFVPFPYFWNANLSENGSGHNYHAGTIKAERKMSNGLYFQAHLTWSKSVGDDWSTPEDAFDRRRERSVGGYVPKLRSVMMAIYELPFGQGKSFGGGWSKPVDVVLGGWSLSGTYVLQSGMYFSPSFSGVDPSNTNRFSGRPDRIGDGNLSRGRPKSERVNEWFDTGAFVRPEAGIGRFGSSGAFVLEGPGINVFHFGMFKTTALTERVKLTLEMTATDFFNHPNFRNPSGSSVRVGTSSYGRLTRTVNYDGNRRFQFTVRLAF